jgi:hypothetical protein
LVDAVVVSVVYAPAPSLRSTSYCVAPAEALQARLTCEGDAAVAENPAGVAGPTRTRREPVIVGASVSVAVIT